MMDSVGSRTRSKNVPLFGCLSLQHQSKTKRVRDSFVYLGSVSACKKIKKQNEDESDHPQFSDKKMSEGCSDDSSFERENTVDEDESEENSEEDSDDSTDEDFEVDEVNEMSDSDEDTSSSSSSLYVVYYNENYYNKKCGISTKPLEEEEIEKSSMKGSSSKVNEVSQKQDKKSFRSSSRAFVDEDQKDIKKKSSLRQQNSVPMVEDIEDSKKDNDNGKANANDDTASPGDSGEAKSPRLAVSLQNQKSAKHTTMENKGKGQRGGNSIGNGKKGTPPLYWSLGKKVEEAAPKTDEEKMICELWDEMDRVIREDEAEPMIGNIGTNEASNKNMEHPLEEEEIDKSLMKDSSSKVNEASQKQDKKSVGSSSMAFVNENQKDKKNSSSRRQQHSVQVVEERDGSNKDKDNGKANANDDTTNLGDSGEGESPRLAASLQNQKLAKHKIVEEEEIKKSSMKGSSSKVNEVSQKQDKKSVVFSLRQHHSVTMMEDIEDSNKDKDKDNGKANANDDTTSPGDSGEAESPRPAVSLQNEKLAKQKIVENKGRGERGGNRICKKETMDAKSGQSKLCLTKELHKLLVEWECYLGSKNTKKNGDSVVLEEVKDDDGVKRQDTRPRVCKEMPPLYWSLGKKVEESTPKMEEEEMICELWHEMDRVSREDEAESMIGNIGTNEASNKNMKDPFSLCNHDTRLDEEIGVYCRLCGLVVTEIRYISEPVVDRYPNEGSGRRATIGGDDVSLFDRSHLNVSNDDSKANLCSHNEGTVWDKIPDVKQTLYPHQQEGFEFIWKNLAGSIELQKLKNADPRSEGGCIISHAPGTGKTRLTIVFLKAYLQVFPKCMPIIVAPASILLTWEEEFKKWDIGVPFHNLSNRELSGKEHADAVSTFDMSNTRHGIEETRMAKLISWFKETSILGISYTLYGMKCKDKKKKKQESVKERKGKFDMRKVLLKAPGLLVLDEGHTPRNQRSRIWKVLSKIQTQKRIILSGTPFQNNFWELYSTLSLVKPSFPDTIPHELKRFCHERGRKSSKEWSWEPVSVDTTRNTYDDKIKRLKLLMDSFVHVHKGAILENKLPGLRDCLVTLKAGSLQNEILKIIKRSQNTVFNFECKIALTSVHPSLLLECDLSEDEESVLNKDQLEKIRLNPYEGVKTKFLCEFVRLCDSLNEKVLVFSQFHAPLRLIKDQLNLVFNWSKGEVLFMSSNDSAKVKQSLIHSFNDENSKAKILLAATKACSEGISLVGASRVVFLDVVWNPSVEKQAISRAYRIGQKKEVHAYRLLAEGTTEEEKYGKQAEKDRLSKLLFSAKTAAGNDDESKNYAVNFEDCVLDKMTRHEKLKDMFVKCVVLRKERDLV